MRQEILIKYALAFTLSLPLVREGWICLAAHRPALFLREALLFAILFCVVSLMIPPDRDDDWAGQL